LDIVKRLSIALDPDNLVAGDVESRCAAFNGDGVSFVADKIPRSDAALAVPLVIDKIVFF